MANGIRTSNPRGFNKGRSSKFRVGSRVRQRLEGRRTYRPKRCGNNNKDEDNNPKTLNDKNHQASSKKFRQLTTLFLVELLAVTWVPCNTLYLLTQDLIPIIFVSLVELNLFQTFIFCNAI